MAKSDFDTPDDIYESLREYVEGVLDETDIDTTRDQLLENIEQAMDDWWPNSIYIPSLDDEDIGDIAEFCSMALKMARGIKCEETDSGLWEGGNAAKTLAGKAYWSCGNVMMKIAEDEFAVDVNDDMMEGFLKYKLQQQFDALMKESRIAPPKGLSVARYAYGVADGDQSNDPDIDLFIKYDDPDLIFNESAMQGVDHAVKMHSVLKDLTTQWKRSRESTVPQVSLEPETSSGATDSGE